MKILIIGSGGREHALAWKIKQSPLVEKIYCAPGNGGIADLAECVDIKADDIPALLDFAKSNAVKLTIVGPEGPLVEGIVDEFEKNNLMIFGPSKTAALLEGSKVFAKEFMHRCNIPTAPFKTFEQYEPAKAFLAKAQYPLVIKADGLAAGKGVIVCDKEDEAYAALDQIMKDKVFKDAGAKVVIEECLFGEEVSILAISDGHNYIVLDSAQDHKRIFDDDLGPNTGGMGAYSPAPIVNEDLLNKIQARVIDPVIRGMLREGNPFKGVLYAGLMITAQGPMVLEFNTRFGDPEAQAVLPRMKNDLMEVLLATCEGRLNQIRMHWDKRNCVCIVMSSSGYPGKYETGKEISGLKDAAELKNTIVFHAGTTKEGDKYLTAGGRVLGVTGLGADIEKAIDTAYEAADKIKFEKCFFRRDIGMKAVRHIQHEAKATTTRPGR